MVKRGRGYKYGAAHLTPHQTVGHEEEALEEGGLGNTVHTYSHAHFVLSLILDDNIFVPHDSTVWASSRHSGQQD